ncbi:MAG: Gluconate dehydratase [uncultured Chloroflexi bacterium]|uniref:Gluconate dehydratase n=1 Tax=uncultured Chloroflexota bacterium TaxID=166587 RepID=A0A6J4J2A6_9CHLR|nr:MAG: Gluconate dehydratase [uncultured Chloroflexota bacterium]
MKITDLKVYPVQGRHWPRFPMVFVEIETDAGLVGLGESLLYKSTGVIESLHQLRPRLVGQDPFRIEQLWELLNRQGVNAAALSGIEMALWDIVGQACGQPIYNLLGGMCRESVRVYVDGFFRGAQYIQGEYAQKAIEAVELGYTALKMDVDEPIPMANRFNRQVRASDLRHMAEMVSSVRDAVGADVDLAIDAHGAFDVASAVRLGAALEPYRLMWIEDPIPMTNMAALAKVAEETTTPICTGELLATRFQFRELFERQAADIIMPDLACCGGILEMKKIAALADTYFVPIAPHNMVGPVATIASAHVCLSTPNFMILEYQLGDVEWIDELISSPVPIRDGQLWLNGAPGLGVTLNHAAVEKYRAE